MTRPPSPDAPPGPRPRGPDLPLRILIIEDQRDLAESLWDFLERRGHRVDHALDGLQGLRMALAGGFDVIVLDLGLPRLDGLDVCARLRAAGQTLPVLMLTARDGLDDKLAGFNRGADDYLVKPFAMSELLARIRMLCRRGVAGPSVTVVGDLEIDPGRREVRRDGVTLSLTTKEFSVLELLASRAGRTVSREQITEHCWDRLTVPMSNAVDVVISQLRRKLGEPSPIRTVRGTGWMLEET